MTSDVPASDVAGKTLCSIHVDLLENLDSNLKMVISKISESGYQYGL